MTHQCLNCGKIIEKGSDEILKGCQQCGGKKFIYVSQPLPQEKRMDLIKRAESVRADMVRKADPELMRVLKERGVTELDGNTLELETSPTGDWLRVRPKAEVSPPRPGPEVKIPSVPPLATPEPAGPKKPSAREIIFEFDRERLTKEQPPTKVTTDKKAAKKARKKAATKPKKRVLKGAKKRTADKVPAKPKRGLPPVGTVNVVEQGVYEIDVERLLRDDPVIIENDGTYLIHLPSMLKGAEDGKGKQRK